MSAMTSLRALAMPRGLVSEADKTGSARSLHATDPGLDNGLPVVLPLIGFTVLAWASVALSPWLIAYPLLLIALNPRMVFLLLVAPRTGLLEFTLVASIRLCLADPFSYMLGVRYGGRLRDRIDRSRLRSWLLRMTRVERSACAVAIWVRPSQTVLAWAGSLHMSPRSVAIADVTTTVAYVILIHQGMSIL